jgi:hypothetical protein
MHISPATRFWRKVDKSGECWLWTANYYTRGYTCEPKFSFGGKNVDAARFAWFLETGESPPKGLMVLHRCGTDLCVRFSHLYLGDHADNMRDMIQQGRSNRKLTSTQVQEIRNLFGGAKRYPGQKHIASFSRIAKIYGVSSSAISHILGGQFYAG